MARMHLNSCYIFLHLFLLLEFILWKNPASGFVGWKEIKSPLISQQKSTFPVDKQQTLRGAANQQDEQGLHRDNSVLHFRSVPSDSRAGAYLRELVNDGKGERPWNPFLKKGQLSSWVSATGKNTKKGLFKSDDESPSNWNTFQGNVGSTDAETDSSNGEKTKSKTSESKTEELVMKEDLKSTKRWNPFPEKVELSDSKRDAKPKAEKVSYSYKPIFGSGMLKAESQKPKKDVLDNTNTSTQAEGTTMQGTEQELSSNSKPKKEEIPGKTAAGSASINAKSTVKQESEEKVSSTSLNSKVTTNSPQPETKKVSQQDEDLHSNSQSFMKAPKSWMDSLSQQDEKPSSVQYLNLHTRAARQVVPFEVPDLEQETLPEQPVSIVTPNKEQQIPEDSSYLEKTASLDTFSSVTKTSSQEESVADNQFAKLPGGNQEKFDALIESNTSTDEAEIVCIVSDSAQADPIQADAKINRSYKDKPSSFGNDAIEEKGEKENTRSLGGYLDNMNAKTSPLDSNVFEDPLQIDSLEDIIPEEKTTKEPKPNIAGFLDNPAQSVEPLSSSIDTLQIHSSKETFGWKEELEDKSKPEFSGYLESLAETKILSEDTIQTHPSDENDSKEELEKGSVPTIGGYLHNLTENCKSPSSSGDDVRTSEEKKQVEPETNRNTGQMVGYIERLMYSTSSVSSYEVKQTPARIGSTSYLEDLNISMASAAPKSLQQFSPRKEEPTVDQSLPSQGNEHSTGNGISGKNPQPVVTNLKQETPEQTVLREEYEKNPWGSVFPALLNKDTNDVEKQPQSLGGSDRTSDVENQLLDFSRGNDFPVLLPKDEGDSTKVPGDDEQHVPTTDNLPSIESEALQPSPWQSVFPGLLKQDEESTIQDPQENNVSPSSIPLSEPKISESEVKTKEISQAQVDNPAEVKIEVHEPDPWQSVFPGLLKNDNYNSAQEPDNSSSTPPTTTVLKDEASEDGKADSVPIAESEFSSQSNPWQSVFPGLFKKGKDASAEKSESTEESKTGSSELLRSTDGFDESTKSNSNTKSEDIGASMSKSDKSDITDAVVENEVSGPNPWQDVFPGLLKEDIGQEKSENTAKPETEQAATKESKPNVPSSRAPPIMGMGLQGSKKDFINVAKDSGNLDGKMTVMSMVSNFFGGVSVAKELQSSGPKFTTSMSLGPSNLEDEEDLFSSSKKEDFINVAKHSPGQGTLGHEVSNFLGGAKVTDPADMDGSSLLKAIDTSEAELEEFRFDDKKSNDTDIQSLFESIQMMLDEDESSVSLNNDEVSMSLRNSTYESEIASLPKVFPEKIQSNPNERSNSVDETAMSLGATTHPRGMGRKDITLLDGTSIFEKVGVLNYTMEDMNMFLSGNQQLLSDYLVSLKQSDEFSDYTSLIDREKEFKEQPRKSTYATLDSTKADTSQQQPKEKIKDSTNYQQERSTIKSTEENQEVSELAKEGTKLKDQSKKSSEISKSSGGIADLIFIMSAQQASAPPTQLPSKAQAQATENLKIQLNPVTFCEACSRATYYQVYHDAHRRYMVHGTYVPSQYMCPICSDEGLKNNHTIKFHLDTISSSVERRVLEQKYGLDFTRKDQEVQVDIPVTPPSPFNTNDEESLAAFFAQEITGGYTTPGNDGSVEPVREREPTGVKRKLCTTTANPELSRPDGSVIQGDEQTTECFQGSDTNQQRRGKVQRTFPNQSTPPFTVTC